jgi:ABC-type antimicrobial peptide transport system permease subunit
MTDREPTPVFVINETLARQAFPGTDPIGKRIRLPFFSAVGFAPVVGVVADLRYSKLGAAIEPELFIDYPHTGIGGATLAIRTSDDPMSLAPVLRTLLSDIDRTQALFDVKPLDVALAESIAPRRLNLLLLGTFALSALLLAIVGMYGVVAYVVAQRTREIGVRIALGAARGQVAAMIVRQGMALALGGIGIGLVVAVASTWIMTTLLYEVTPTDPATFAAAVATVSVTALVACSGPAVRASRVDPLVAFRCE